MSNIFSFSLSDTASGDINEALFRDQVAQSSLPLTLMNFIRVSQEVNLVFGTDIGVSDEQILQTLVQTHAGLGVNLSKTVQVNKIFADEMMQSIKEKNLLEGLSSIDQAAWVHHRLRKIDYTLSDATTVVQIDVMNLIVSGDIETAEFVLGQMTPDDMTESYHWLTQARLDWIRNEIRSYLGWPLI